jgi:hypothetical protein
MIQLLPYSPSPALAELAFDVQVASAEMVDAQNGVPGAHWRRVSWPAVPGTGVYNGVSSSLAGGREAVAAFFCVACQIR